MFLNGQNCGPCWAPRCVGQQQPRAAAAPTVASSRAGGCSPHVLPLHISHAVGSSRCLGSRRGAAARAIPSEGRIDVVGFGNLCVDAVLPLESLPPADTGLRRRLLDTLTASPPDKSSWEVGGNCNFMVAGARLGLRVASVGHIGRDVYGNFMDEVLREEGVQATTRIAPPPNHQPSTTNGSGGAAATNGASGCLDSTLICFVLVDPDHHHAFCSRYDFGPWPLLEGIGSLPEGATSVLRSSRAIFTNGFIFDELPLAAVKAACSDAIEHGSSIFFDPGPRCQTMMEGPRRAALDLLLELSAVVLMTEEEARVVTGLDDPEEAAKTVLARPGARAQWVVVKMGAEGSLLCARGKGGNGNGSGNGHANGNGSGGQVTTTRMGAVKVDVVDTVGCGDSFASAVVMGYINGWPVDVTLALANAVGGATATGRGAGRNVARLGTVLALLEEGAAGGAGPSAEQRSAFARARELLLQSTGGRQGQGQLSAAA